jgi:hypothetical protein
MKKCYHSLKRLVPDNMPAHPLYYVESFAGRMDMPFDVVRISKEIAENI